MEGYFTYIFQFPLLGSELEPYREELMKLIAFNSLYWVLSISHLHASMNIMTFNSLYWVRRQQLHLNIYGKGLSFNSLYWVLVRKHGIEKLLDANFQFPLLGSEPFQAQAKQHQLLLSIPFIGFAFE